MTSSKSASPKRLFACLLLTPMMAACGAEQKPEALQPKTFALQADPRQTIEDVDPLRGKVMSKSDLHALLDRLLSEHSALAVQLMRAVVDRSPDQQPSTDALVSNTADLTSAIGVVYGKDGAFAFDQLWKQHIQFFANYAAADSPSERVKAMTDLHDYQTDFSSFTTTATGGRLPLNAVVQLLHTHIEQLIAALDAYRARDYATAVARQHDARLHMYEISSALASAISDQQPGVFPSELQTTNTSQAHLISELAQLRLDLAWAKKLRPKMLPAFEAFSSSDAFRSVTTDSLNLGSCTAMIDTGAYQDAAQCTHKLFAGL